ncbi:MAG: SRPBCC family protein [Conexibacter sp.]
MPKTRVERTLAADPQAVWAVLADPHHLPRWWPRVRRVEGVDADRFTQVLATERGRGVRADFRVLDAEPPRLLRWTQELEGTPFERLLVEARTTLALTPDGAGTTTVAIELQQRLRGWSRLVPFLFRRAARAQLAEALDGLERAVVGEPRASG